MLHQPSIPSARRTPRRTALLGAVVAAAPLLVVIASFVSTPSFSRPMFAEFPTLFGVRHEDVVLVLALVWGGIGGYLVAKSRSRWVLPCALVFFTLPACLAIILGPAIILILLNLG